MISGFSETMETIGRGLIFLAKKIIGSNDRLMKLLDRSLGFYCSKCERYDVSRRFIGMESVSGLDEGIAISLVYPVWEVTCPECKTVSTVQSPF